MQTENQTSTRSSWSDWAVFLRRRRLDSLASWALDALAPLAVVGAQLLHVGSPLLRPALGAGQAEMLASLLEDPAESRQFAAYLREAASS